ncbi:MAG TPA: hypothetical protein HA232_02405 [Methanocellales archaeon]|nr:hypothetical protein [Methanocellales archaeon]
MTCSLASPKLILLHLAYELMYEWQHNLLREEKEGAERYIASHIDTTES